MDRAASPRFFALRRPGFRRAVLAMLLAASSGFALPAMAQAAPGTRPAPANPAAQVPGYGASGAFLAGVVANNERDTAAAAAFFREALRADPRNPGLLDQAFLAELVDGNAEEAFRLAEKAVQRDKSNALAHVALGVRALKNRQYERAKASFDRAGGNVRDADLTIALLRAWAMVGMGEVSAALQNVDRFKDNELRGYRDFFAGLMAEVARRPGEAEARLESAYKVDSNILRVVDAYARILSRRGKIAEAIKVIDAWKQRNPNQPYLDRQAAQLAKGEPLPPLAGNIAEGTAEVFYGLGAVGSAARDPMSGVTYLQLARFLSPKDEIVTTTLAEFFEQLRQHARAAQLFETIPASSVLANRAAIGRASALERMERTDDAIVVLRELLARQPGELEAADTLGTILRIKKRWEESIAVYTAAIDTLGKVEQKHWPLFFGRAIGYERSKQWAKAEPDFITALDLLPARPRTPRERLERAQVLNYLAYSWVDMRMNIEKSFEMLREAVAFAPNDGAIVDSLGWAFYRLGRYDDAVRELERAILMKAGDPTINDHLGDAYWKVGRTREARFKWEQALGLNPEPDDAEKIRRKLQVGLEEGPAANAAAPKPNGG